MLNTIEDAIEDFKNGKFLVVVDDEDRENEGDFIIAAEKITPEKVNFMLHEGRGVLCCPLPMARCKELGLSRQTVENTSVLGTPFTIMVDKIEGCTTGVSALAVRVTSLHCMRRKKAFSAAPVTRKLPWTLQSLQVFAPPPLSSKS